MSLAPRLDLRQSQQLVMTPQLQLAIKLLQLTNLELEAHIAGEIESNPLIEMERGEEVVAADSSPAEAHVVEGPSTPVDDMRTDELIERGEGLADQPLDADFIGETFHHAADEFSSGNGPGSAGSSSGNSEVGGDIDALAEATPSLCDHMNAQAAAQLTGVNLAVARFLIDQIDDAGYLRIEPAEVAAALGITDERVAAIVRMIQTFDPTGVGARTLAECLMLQAREADLLDRPMRLLLKNLDVLAKGDLAALRRICGLDADALAGLIRCLRRFDPKPGLRYGRDNNPTVTPDVIVRRTAKGWAIELNQATLPRVLVNHGYHAELARGAKGPAKSFLSECMSSANWLSKALDQRARTIVTVSTEIVRHQEGFFERGVHHLRPLNLKTVAAAVGMHESTISRVTSHKYLSCERGVFELKYFFAPGLAVVGGGDGEGVSTTAIKRRIRELIGLEASDSVQSDEALVETLKREGFDVARRTVAKYREQQNLGSSVDRRRRLMLQG